MNAAITAGGVCKLSLECARRTLAADASSAVLESWTTQAWASGAVWEGIMTTS